jgi:hypothetical protein
MRMEDETLRYRAQNEAYKIEKTKKWEKSMNDRELER